VSPFEHEPSPTWVGRCRACGSAVPEYCVYCVCLEHAMHESLGEPDAVWKLDTYTITREGES
jgi:hypothetical protein